MKRISTAAFLLALALGAAAGVSCDEAQAGNRAVARQAARRSWHGQYYETEYGWTVAQVVPPNAHFQTAWSWGAAQTTMTPIYHQFGRGYPIEAYNVYGEPFLPTPRWPGHTDQFGVYNVRGPW